MKIKDLKNNEEFTINTREEALDVLDDIRCENKHPGWALDIYEDKIDEAVKAGRPMTVERDDEGIVSIS